jgi:general secretion pathway protein L
MITLLHLAPTPRWQRLDGGRVIASGAGLPAPDAEATLIVAVPGEAVSLRRVDLPDALSPAQALAAARLLAAEQAADAVETLHVAVSPGPGPRWLALVARDAMAGWQGLLAHAGLRADAMVPDMLLLPAPADGVALLAHDGRVLGHGSDLAFVAEPDLVPLLLAGRGSTNLSDPPPQLAPLSLDLLQGDYAQVQPWAPAKGAVRRLAWLAAAAVGLWLAGDVAAWWQAARAADAAEDRLVAAASAALPAGAVPSADTAAAAVAQRARLVGADGGLLALAAPVLAAVAAAPEARLTGLNYSVDGGLIVVMAGDAAARDAVLAAAAAAGLQASAGAPRAEGEATVIDIRVLPR